MNPSQKLYEETLENIRSQFQLARSLNKDARIEWYQEVQKLLAHEMSEADYSVYDGDGF